MDIWEIMYEKAKALYRPHEVSDFVYAQHVVAAIEAEMGKSIQAFVWKGPVESSICVQNEWLSLICTKHLVKPRWNEF